MALIPPPPFKGGVPLCAPIIKQGLLYYDDIQWIIMFRIGTDGP